MRFLSDGSRIRPAAVAGLFYPAEPDRLRTEIDAFMRATGPAEPARALIAPHAGYIYSGEVAAAAFAACPEAQGISRAVVIGPAHHVWFRGIAIPTATHFETPLGRVPVDREALAEIAELPFVTRDDAPHAPEHALEVELPFLQARFDSFSLVPLLVGEAEPKQVAEALRRLWTPETLIVVSSDLSHYHDDATARRLDAATAAAIERGDWTGLGPRDACGFLAVAGLLIEAGRRGLRARRLALRNSGDTAGSRDRVVGYGAWAFTEAERA
jgi:AmmeMemoRadiSam system protein B